MSPRASRILSVVLFLSLLTWGFWTMLVYLGVPTHVTVLVSDAMLEKLKLVCPSGGYFCRGAYAFFPFILYTLTRIDFLGWYALISVLLYLIALAWNYLRTMRFGVSIQMTPWKMLLLFLGCMWLIFTSMSFMKSGDLSIRHFVEPNPDVYRTAGAEAIEILTENFNRLKDAGCLMPTTLRYGSAPVYDIRGICMQGAFFTRVMPPFLVVLVLLFEFLVAGRFVLRRLTDIRPKRLLTEAMLSTGLGIAVWVALLWFGAVFRIFTAPFGWVLVVAVPAICYRDCLYWLKAFAQHRFAVERKWYSPEILLFWLLLSYLALNFINVVRPFPIGWDDLGSYLNRPHLLVSYGHFIHSMASFQWEYLTALGYLLFGFGSDFGATSSMMINWTQGLLAAIAVYGFTNVFLGRGRGILAAILYYFLPLVGHFSYADMKIDNAVFLMGTLAAFALFLYLFRPDEEETYPRALVAIAGVFLGFAFGFKVTAVMVALAFGAVLLGAQLHAAGFIAASFFAVAVLIERGALQIPVILERVASISPAQANTATFIASLGLGAGVLAYAIVRAGRERVRDTALSVAFLVAGFLIAVFPWIEHNNIILGRVIPWPELGAPNTLTPIMDPHRLIGEEGKGYYYTLPPELAVDKSNPACKPTGGDEELGRYWGDRKGWNHYVTLPMRTVMNLDSAGYYVTTMPALLLFPLLLLLPFFWKRKEAAWLRWLWIGTVFIVVQWVFLAKGIPWYGIGMFLGTAVGLEALLAKAPDILNRILIAFLLTVSVVLCLAMRFWQFETQRNLFEYALGKASKEVLLERTISHYDEITDIVIARHEQMPERPLLYRVGTFIPYFMPKNLEVIGVTDHQLDFFNCIDQERNNALTLERLKLLGFNSIIFDTNTATIERDLSGSLHQKVARFAAFLNSFKNGEVKVVINDPEAGVVLILIP